MNPKVSIIMPVFNQEEYLKKSLESILNQSYKDFEFLILDDRSTDKSNAIIKNYQDKRIKVFQNKTRQRLAKCLNFLINKAKGKYIARMDGDDISLPHRLKVQADFFDKHNKVVLVGTWAKIIDKKERIIGQFKYPCSYQQIRKDILKYNPFIHPSIMFRKKIVKDIGGYNEKFTYSQDYDLFLRLAAKYKCENIPEFLLNFRWLPNFSKQKQQHLSALKIRFKAIKEYGYSKKEIVKLLKPLLYYLVPVQLKKYYWQGKLY